MKYDETGLIEFFQVLPQKQCKDDKEFFGTTVFEIIEDLIKLQITLCDYEDYVYITMINVNTSKSILDLVFKNIEEVKVAKDEKVKFLSLSEPKENQLKEIVRLYIKPIRIRNYQTG